MRPPLPTVGNVNVLDQWITDYAALYHGDAINLTDGVPSESIAHWFFSPPFPGMYAYTNSTADIGNCEHINQMIEHFEFLVPGLYRTLWPGRICGIHLMQLTAMLTRDGYIGLKDYRGRVIDMMERHGFIYHGEVTIDKNPQVQAVRNKERGLLFKTLATDSANMRMALADYVIWFRKPGTNPAPIPAGMSPKYNPGRGWITEREWIRWARPVWYSSDWLPKEAVEIVVNEYGVPEAHWAPCVDRGISMTDVLNVRQARETDDERHLCPLQLGVCERDIKLYTNPGEPVGSPFAGISSEGYTAVKFERLFVGFELKRSYWFSGQQNLQEAYRLSRPQLSFLDMLDHPAPADQ